ncbi:c-type cytochrome [Oceanibium sediminis]|uniref:c-type cytochrome n=1 Tax=Oceanibium sediminis TaxID=2026339 RepID=UPI000DD4C954|nr:cytochrome c family protein [Oceanibium sediminis]
MTFTFFRAAVCAAAVTFAPAGYAQDIGARLASADQGAGEKIFRQCQTCHAIDNSGARRVGPDLYGVVGREVASVEGFRYSPAMQELGGAWTPERLDAYLEDPRGNVPGTRMSFRGLRDAQERADVIAYLNSQSDAPLDLAGAGSDAAASGDTQATAEAEAPAEEDFGQLVVAPGAEETYYACTACHSEMIVAQQGKTREGWDKLFDWMIEEQGMAELPEDERNIILDYLAAHYNTDRPNFPRP